MRRRRTHLALLLAALLCLTTLPGGPIATVRGVDVGSTTAIDGPASAFRGDTVHFTAQVEPAGAQGIVWFESSIDGVTWTGMGGYQVLPDGTASTYPWISSSVPLGTWLVRARYSASPGWTDSTSDPVAVEVALHPSSISWYGVFAPGHNAIAPGTTPVRLYLTVDHVGRVVFEELTADGPVTLADGGVSPGPGDLYADVGPLGEGTHTLRASWVGDDYDAPASATTTVAVPKLPTTSLLSVPAQVQANHSFEYIMFLNYQDPGLSPGGATTITDTATGVVLLDSPTWPGSGMIGPLALGHHDLVVAYAGDANFAPSVSPPVPVQVVADSVDATGVGLSASSVYPIVDGYRDTVTVRGDRTEPISVSIRVYNGSNHVVRSSSIAVGTGPYAWRWSGRSSAGTLQPAGRYRVVQSLRDGAGTVRTVSSWLTLSRKRLHYVTTTITKYGNAYSASGRAGEGSISRSGSRFSGGVVIRGGVAGTSGGTGWAAVGYSFSLPSAVVYRSISVKAYGLTTKVAGFGELGVWDWTVCPSATATWPFGCFHRWRDILYSTAWYSRPISVTGDRHGRTVRSAIWVDAGQWPRVDIGRVAVTVTYGVLR